jgi:hypothetical protein
MHVAKKLEEIVFAILNGTPFENTGDVDIAKQIVDNINKVIDGPIKTMTLKPKVKTTPTYGKKTEPKTDLLIITDRAEFKFSIKKDKHTYTHTSNSYEDSKVLFFGFDYSNLLTLTQKETVDTIISENLKKITNFEKWPQSKGNYDDFVKYQLGKMKSKITTWVGPAKFDEIEFTIIKKYRDTLESGEKPYTTQLHSMESNINRAWEIMIRENREYGRHLLFEMCTGNYKFGKTSHASANWIVSSEGVWELTDPNCEWVTLKLEQLNSYKTIGRLQNVPRASLTRWTVVNEPLDIIAESFPTADMSMKL